jgi:hypothetical protein
MGTRTYSGKHRGGMCNCLSPQRLVIESNPREAQASNILYQGGVIQMKFEVVQGFAGIGPAQAIDAVKMKAGIYSPTIENVPDTANLSAPPAAAMGQGLRTGSYYYSRHLKHVRTCVSASNRSL